MVTSRYSVLVRFVPLFVIVFVGTWPLSVVAALLPHAVPTPTSIASANCQTAIVPQNGDSFPEMQGQATRAELWALLFPLHELPIYVDEEIKIVWRMTDKGPFKLVALLPDGTRVEPIWGPEEHGGSSWQRPGDEWGTGFRFPRAGCWRLIASRDNSVGEIRLLVIINPDNDIF